MLNARRARPDGLQYLDLPRAPVAHSFLLPKEVADYTPAERSRAMGLFIEALDCLDALEAAIGWWPSHGAGLVVPVYTSADLNCLLHACSLTLAGVRDTLSPPDAEGRGLLRDTLFQSLLACPALLRVAQAADGPARADEVLALARQNRCALDGAHIFALANVLRRPLLCYAPAAHEGAELRHVLTPPFRMSGVYLPLLWDPADCSPEPLLVAYTRGHFTGLCPVEPATGIGHVTVPLYDAEGAPLPVPYARAAGDGAKADGAWLGWAGDPPGPASDVPRRDCRALVGDYLEVEQGAQGLCARMRAPESEHADAPASGPGSSCVAYRSVVAAGMRKRLAQLEPEG